MSLPLATLRRGSELVAFHRWPPPSARRFRRHDEAVAFLRFWARDSAAMFALRGLLRAVLRSGPLFALSDPQVLDVLGACLADGTVSIAGEGAPEATSAGAADGAAAQQAAGSDGAPAAADAAPKAPAPPIPPAAPAPPVPPEVVLAALEEVQLESADVRPEVEQSLAELDACQAQVDLATVSLAPTPSKVEPISATMNQSSAGAVQAIDDL